MKLDLKLFREALNKLPKFPWFFDPTEKVITDKDGHVICMVNNSDLGFGIADLPSSALVLINRIEQLEEAIKLHRYKMRNKLDEYNVDIDNELWNVL